MKRKAILVIAVMYLLIFVSVFLVPAKPHNTQNNQLQVRELNAELAAIKQELSMVKDQVYEQDRWLAELQADVWSLQAQDEAFNLRRLR